jgi:GT2 family glycosyltransferase
MEDDRMLVEHPRRISIVVTTHRTDSLYTQACLESIRSWKMPHHELIVVTHDESALLRAYLEACAADRLIDRLVFADANHGHTRSFNLGLSYAGGDVVFNICNDILIGPALVDHCAWQLRNDPQLGVVGWHWYSEGTFWKDGRIDRFNLRDASNPLLTPEHEGNIRKARWFTGRYFAGVGGRALWLHVCNTGFFGARTDLLRSIGGFGREYRHYWADDFLSYAVLDRGLDVRNFDRRFRAKAYFSEFQYDHVDVPDRRRHEDRLIWRAGLLDVIRPINGGMSDDESVFLHFLAKAIPEGATVTSVGVWLGASAIVLLDALRGKRATLHFIDCFDLPGISAMSAQPPVTEAQFLMEISAFIDPQHTVSVHKANTLDIDRFPRSDFVFLDAGHTRACVRHDGRLIRECLAPGGTAAFHDYGCPVWPDVKPELDAVFPELEYYHTVAVHRTVKPARESFHWLPVAPVKDGAGDAVRGR